MEPRRINNSEIQSFKRCKRKWMLEYYLKLERQSESSALRVGTLVHKGLEDYYSGGNVLANISRLRDEEFTKESLKTGFEPEVSDPDLDLAERMLEGYPDWVEEGGYDAGFEVLAVEELLEANLGEIAGREVILHGRSDLKLSRDGEIGLIDNKTVQNFGDFADRRLQLNEQLLTYSVLSKLAKGEDISWAAINMLRKVKRTGSAKPPFYAREYVYFNQTQLKNHYQHLHSTITDLLNLENYLKENTELTNPAAYPTVDKDCSWKCPFLGICSMFDDGSDIEGALNLFKRKVA